MISKLLYFSVKKNLKNNIQPPTTEGEKKSFRKKNFKAKLVLPANRKEEAAEKR